MTRYRTYARLRPIPSLTRIVLILMMWIWGLAGFVAFFLQAGRLVGGQTTGETTAASGLALMVTAPIFAVGGLLWLGGLVLLGLSVASVPLRYYVEQPEKVSSGADARPDWRKRLSTKW